MKRRLLIGAAAVVLVLAVAVLGSFYNRYEYQPVTYNFPDGSSASISRHNLNKMTAAQRQAFLHPVNETVLHPCAGNPQDQCILAQSIDLWPGGSESASNPALKPVSGQPNEIMGRVIDDSSNNLQLKTSSGRIISIAYPTNVAQDFNTSRAANYGLTITTGDAIYTSYTGTMSGNVINTDQIIRSQLLIAGNAKVGPISKY